jgi:hypothetical protein
MAVTNAVSWRTEGIRYRKNEVFLDVIEGVNMLVGFFLIAPKWIKLTDVDTGQREWERREVRNSRCRKDEVLPLRNARTPARTER